MQHHIGFLRPRDVRPLVCEALTNNTLKRIFSALSIFDAQSFSVVVQFRHLNSYCHGLASFSPTLDWIIEADPRPGI